ncbi:MAG: IS200/IS605 family element transposase accessory protein TnpB [Pleurocapsa sp. SU_196_0]|nr:IS200/IS605 family element transposase accessory protein TnpB [Pleurocapsa sp. SU_196_0]
MTAGYATVVTLQGRQRLEFCVPKFWAEVATWRSTSADLCVDCQGQLWLHVVMRKEVAEVPPTGDVIGVDLGITHPATDSNGKHYGDPYWTTVECHRKSHVSRLQSKGTKSARRRLKKLSGTRNRLRSDCDHVISRQIVNALNSGDTVVFEDLVNIRGRGKLGKQMRERLHTWSFDRLQFYVGYKSLERGITVDFVDPRFTSQKCCKCGHIDRGNRVTQSGFTCLSCGHTDNADVNAAMNIRDDFVRSRAAFNQPIVGSGAATLPLTDKPATLVVGN